MKQFLFFVSNLMYNNFNSNQLYGLLNINIGKKCFIKKSQFYGTTIIGNSVKIQKCTLRNNIKIRNDVNLYNSLIIGNLNIYNNTQIISTQFISITGTIMNNCNITNSAFSGNIKIGKTASIENSNINGDIKVGSNFKIFGGIHINGIVEVGNYTSINGPNTDIFTSINKVKIGNFCSIARNVSIQEYNHKIKRVSTYHMCANVFNRDRIEDIESKGDIVIENDVWIGTHCVILSGAHISNGAIIAANSVVNGYIPPYAIAAGSPAKVIKYRFSEEIINNLLEIKWWEWSDDKIKLNKVFLTSDTLDLKSIK